MKVEPAPISLPSVVIELTPTEAQAIMDVLGQVTGPTNGPRKYTGELWNKLKNLGYNWKTHNRISGTLRFME